MGQGVQSRPHRGTRAAEQQGMVSLWPLEHGGAVGTSQQVQTVQSMCVAPAQCVGGDSFLSPLNPDHSLPSPEHPDCGYTFLINVINGN